MTKDIIEAMYEGKDMGIPANIHDIPFFKEQLLQMNNVLLHVLLIVLVYDQNLDFYIIQITHVLFVVLVVHEFLP